MARSKFDFGIDLGTTNSAIAVMDNGKLKIIKSDGYMKDTTPSRVQFTKKAIRVGDHSDILKNPFSEFKRTMGTDKSYHNSFMDKSFDSEELSAEVLKKLKGYVTDETVQAAVITVPNQFRQNQIDATQRAAELAGFTSCELLQEPIAASMAFAAESETLDGYWIVFDFGGGTYDAALMKVDEGIMKVIDTGGDNNLGGKDIDLAIVDQILVPKLKSEYEIDELLEDEEFRLALKRAAESLKISLSSKQKADYDEDTEFEDDDGEEFELDFEITIEQYESVVTPIFQKAINITKDLLSRNNLNDEQLGSILLVGGPTFSQTLRNMMKDQFSSNIDTSIDPMTSVALGAALYASTCSIPEEQQQRDLTKVQLKYMYPETTVETEETLGVKVDRNKTDGEVPDIIWLEVSRADGGWSSGKIELEEAELVELQLFVGKPNLFNVKVSDSQGNMMPCEPANFTIIQGLKAAKPTLPHSICIDSILTGSGRQRLSRLEGLEKNNTLPATGKGSFKTPKAIRPGNSNDVIKIPIVEGEQGQQSKLNHVCAIIELTGDDFAELLPEASEIELTLKFDTSRRVTLEAYLPYIDETVEKIGAENKDTQLTEIDFDTLHSEIKKAQHAISFLEDDDTYELNQELESLSERLDNCNNDYDAKVTIGEHLNEALRKVDLLEDSAEWPKVKKSLLDSLEDLKETNSQYGNQESSDFLNQIEQKSKDVIRRENVRMANDLLEQIHALSFQLVRQDTGLWISYIKGFDDEFYSHQWSDESKARHLISDAKHIISTQPSRERLERIVFQLFDLLPGKDKPVVDPSNTDLLLK